MSLEAECSRSRPCAAHPTSPAAKRRPTINSAVPSSDRKAALNDLTSSSMAKGPVCGRLNLRLDCLISVIAPDQPEHRAAAAALNFIKGQPQAAGPVPARLGWAGYRVGGNRLAHERRRGFAIGPDPMAVHSTA
jgi:hypothetical protein